MGFEQAGFDIVAAADIDPIQVATHARNFPACTTIQADLSQISGDEFRRLAGLSSGEVDVVFGGPPCQGFSLMGKRLPADPRNHLLIHFARLVAQLSPRYFVIENVEGLLVTHARTTLTAFSLAIRRFGYRVVAPIRVLNAEEFGLPQRRKRAFIVGYKTCLTPPAYPNGNLPRLSNLHRVSVWDAIGDLPPIERSEELLTSDLYLGPLGNPTHYSARMRGLERDQEDLSLPRDANGLTGCKRTRHSATTVRRFAATSSGAYEPVSRFYRLSKDGLAPALRGGTDARNGSFTAPRPIHPVSPRCITVREGARLQGFPDWFFFHPTIWHGFRQVGNSVPPPLARAVAEAVRMALRRAGTARLAIN